MWFWYQATKEEVTAIFKTFGELSAVRLPRKMAGTGDHRFLVFLPIWHFPDVLLFSGALLSSSSMPWATLKQLSRAWYTALTCMGVGWLSNLLLGIRPWRRWEVKPGNNGNQVWFLTFHRACEHPLNLQCRAHIRVFRKNTFSTRK